MVKTETEIIDKIISNLPFGNNDISKRKVLNAREKQNENALQSVSEEILDILQKLKAMDIKLGLISNADVIDCKYWNQSPLCQSF